jgi:hypothetical protein
VFSTVANVGGDGAATAADGHPASSAQRIEGLSRSDVRGALPTPTDSTDARRRPAHTHRADPTPTPAEKPNPSSPSSDGVLDKVLKHPSALTDEATRLASSAVPSPTPSRTGSADGSGSRSGTGDSGSAGDGGSGGPGDGGSGGGLTRADQDAPQTSITRTQLPDGSVLFRFSSDETATFSCSLDGAGWQPCAASTTYSTLEPGWHTLEVRATDLDGNTDPTPAQTSWKTTGQDGSPALP